MKAPVGILALLTDTGVSITELAPEVESRGFESLWIGEHSHLPVDTVHPRHQPADGGLPDFYRRLHDPFIALAAAATLTSRVRLGTAVALIAEHPPLILAKTIASLDRLSGGRVELGVGFGWNPLEMRNNGIDPTARRAILREKALAMKRLWSEEVAAFDGEHVRFTASWSRPKPAQQGGPPVLLGAAPTDRNLDLIAELADGWLPSMSRTGELATSIARLRRRVAAAGRDPDRVPVTLLDSATVGHQGDVEEWIAGTRSLHDPNRWFGAGISRLVVSIPTHNLDVSRRALDHARAVADRLDAR